jgi:uncharacterized peroxidase-related enzyme
MTTTRTMPTATTITSMTSMTIHDSQSAEPASVSLLSTLEAQLGFIPNVFAVMAESSHALSAFMGLNQHFGASSLSATERELVQLVASAENGCGYCLAGHTTFARDQDVDPALIDALRRGIALPEPRLEALVGLTRALIRTSGHACDDAFVQFFEAGYTQQQALEVIIGISVKTISNLASNAFAIPIDDAFASCVWTPVHTSEGFETDVA